MIRGSRDGGRPARAGRPAVVSLLAMLLVAACGSGAFQSPDSRSSSSSARESSERPGSDSSASRTPGPGEPGGPVTYTYSLPEGDTSHADENGVMYWLLFSGSCAQAQAHLDDSWPWGFQSPEEVLMFQVGASMCTGDDATAAAQFDRGESRYGWAGVATFGRNLCNIYRAYRSYRDQQPQDAISCPGGELVYWPDPDLRDDPRTDAVEAVSSDRPGEPYTEEPPPEPAPESSPPDTSPPLPGEPGDTGTTTPPEGTPEPTTTPPAPDQTP